MPYPSYVKMTDDDIGALYAFFMNRVEPANKPNRPSGIEWPLNMRWPLALWNAVFVDGGVSANLPLDAALGEPSTEPTLCIAVDLFPLAAPRPQSIGEAVGRAQDLTFALQSRRSIDHWRSVYAHDPRFAGASMTLVRLAYVDQAPEVAGKAMDFSTISTQHRWAAGYRDASKMLQELDWDALQCAQGLTVAGD